MTRRRFLQATGASVAALALPSYSRTLSANDKLNIGVIGVAGRGGEDLHGVSSQNIVALCDIDDKNLAAAAAKFPSAKTYNDFRRLVDQKDIDAIVVGTPDHTHAVACVAALKTGRHLYCEKPLTRTLSECRRVREIAAKEKLVTQMGTQIHAGTNYRRGEDQLRYYQSAMDRPKRSSPLCFRSPTRSSSRLAHRFSAGRFARTGLFVLS